jgi:hypothetical protein
LYLQNTRHIAVIAAWQSRTGAPAEASVGDAAAASGLREALAVAEADAAELRARLDATAAEADSAASALGQDAARLESARSELAAHLSAATSTCEVGQIRCRLQATVRLSVTVGRGHS